MQNEASSIVNFNSAMSAGFTLIELMIVVAIVGILAAIAIPKFADLVRKSNEGACKGNLASIRSALVIYYGDMSGEYPVDPVSLTTGGKYLAAIPKAKIPNYHTDASAFNNASGAASISNAGGWAYDNGTTDVNFGTVWVNCTDTDMRGSSWTLY